MKRTSQTDINSFTNDVPRALWICTSYMPVKRNLQRISNNLLCRVSANFLTVSRVVQLEVNFDIRNYPFRLIETIQSSLKTIVHHFVINLKIKLR